MKVIRLSLFLAGILLCSSVTDDRTYAENSLVVPVSYSPPKVEIISPDPPKYIAKSLVFYIIRECDYLNIPYLLAFKLIEHESGWHIYQRTPNYRYHLVDGVKTKYVDSVDIGLMQLNSKVVDQLIEELGAKGRKYNISKNPYDNIDIGLRFLADLYQTTGSWYDAVRAYNAGLRNIKSKKAIEYGNHIIPVDRWWDLPENVILTHAE